MGGGVQAFTTMDQPRCYLLSCHEKLTLSFPPSPFPETVCPHQGLLLKRTGVKGEVQKTSHIAKLACPHSGGGRDHPSSSQTQAPPSHLQSLTASSECRQTNMTTHRDGSLPGRSGEPTGGKAFQEAYLSIHTSHGSLMHRD